MDAQEKSKEYCRSLRELSSTDYRGNRGRKNIGKTVTQRKNTIRKKQDLNKLQILFLFDSLKGFCLIFFFPMVTALCRGSF